MTQRTETTGTPGAGTTPFPNASVDTMGVTHDAEFGVGHDVDVLEPLDAGLLDFVNATRDALDAEIVAHAPTPDAAAALRLAHVLDQDAVPAAWAERAELENNVVPLQRRSTADAEALAPFIAALRASVGEAALERRLAGIPELVIEGSTPAPSRNQRSTARWMWAAGIAAVIAVAAFAGAVGGVSSLGREDAALVPMASMGSDQARRTPPEFTGTARAPSSNATESHTPVASEGGADLSPSDSSAPSADDATSLALADEAGGVVHVDPSVPLDAEGASPTSRRVHRVRSQASSTVAAMEGGDTDVAVDSASSSLDDRLRALEVEAATAWRGGQLDDAVSALERIIELGGTRRRVEAAFADLFAITRQRSAGETRERELASLWSRYLERFPRGRHADDARAGLCRIAPTNERETCWREYLEGHPDGEHVDAARRALGSSEASPG